MQIKVYIKDGYVAFECEGIFLEPVQKILIDRQTRIFKAVLEWSGDEIELDCPVDDEMLTAIGEHDVCGLGYFYQGQMLGSDLIPFGEA